MFDESVNQPINHCLIAHDVSEKCMLPSGGSHEATIK